MIYYKKINAHTKAFANIFGLNFKIYLNIRYLLVHLNQDPNVYYACTVVGKVIVNILID
jgi:hypothetical protein